MMYGDLCAEFYDADKKMAAEEELQLYEEYFTKEDILLEPMCGTGRLLIPLLQKGYKVEGFDNSHAMLERCERKAKELALKAIVYETTIEDFIADHSYDGILIPLGSFQLLYPREKACQALKACHQWLKPEGKLMMDFFIPWEALYENAINEEEKREVNLPDKNKIILESKTIINKYEQHLSLSIHYKKIFNDTVMATEEEKMDILWYYLYEVELLLEKYGFKDIKRLNRKLYEHDYFTIIASPRK